MKKLFISCPMKGRPVEAINESFEKMHKIAEIIFGEELEVIQSYIDDEPDTKSKAAFYLGRSIQMMSEADYFIGTDIYSHVGCRIESMVAREYDIEGVWLPHKSVAPDLEDGTLSLGCIPGGVL